jgi:hypothetical protein
MPEPSPNFTIRIDHYHHNPRAEASIIDALAAMEARIMSKLTPQLDRLESAIADMESRLAADVAELQRRVAEGQATPEEEARLEELVSRINATDIVPDFPAPEPPAGPVEPEPANPDEPPAE